MSSSKLMLSLSRNPGQFWRDYRRICMSVLSQDETKGQHRRVTAEEIRGLSIGYKEEPKP